MDYWENRRDIEKRFIVQLMTGLPVGLLFALPIMFILLTSKYWFKRADMVANSQMSVSVLVIAVLFIACFAFSFGPVCWIIISEIFPNAVRGRAMSLATLSLWIGNFFVGQLTPTMLKSSHWGPSATFWTFAVLCAPAIWITWKLIPETKGRTLEEIEQYWKSRKIKKVI